MNESDHDWKGLYATLRGEVEAITAKLDRLVAWFSRLPIDERLHNHDELLEIVRDARQRTPPGNAARAESEGRSADPFRAAVEGLGRSIRQAAAMSSTREAADSLEIAASLVDDLLRRFPKGGK